MKRVSLAAAVAVLIGLLSAVSSAAPLPRTARPGDRPARGAVVAFRVDVSRYPRVAMVVTVPGPQQALRRNDFLVISGGRSLTPGVRLLTPGDIELVLAPDVTGTVDGLRPQWGAAARFLAGLPAGARTAVAAPSSAGILIGPLSADPAQSVAMVAAPAASTAVPASVRLAASLSAFTRGSRVRRTVVLVVAADEPLTPAVAARFGAQLAASGTALYVLDAAERPAHRYDALATASGGSAFRIQQPGDWLAAFRQISSDLSRQYYLQFADRTRLPGRAVIGVRTSAGVVRGTAGLPAANPIAPPPAVVSGTPVQQSWDSPFVWLAALLIVLGVGYGLGMLAMSRCEPRRRAHRRQRTVSRAAHRPAGPGGLFFVFLMPCLNEETVLPNSLRRLLSIPGGNFVVMVIDDGSDDRTVEAISGLLGERVWLLSRKAPDARQGKGEALNAAIRYLTSSGLLNGHHPGDVITVVVDADGRLDPDAVAEVARYFSDPAVGAVQIGVRINNRDRSRLARMQDIEFVVYTEVFQRGRRHLDSVGLGGNGQFVRLSALLSLGTSPWTRSLTDDLDLGVRLIAAGWRNEYCSRVAVHQQGVVELRRLIRQRSRWFQGHLQSWKLIPLILRRVRGRARADLFYHLTSPAILLVASLLSVSFVVSVADCIVLAAQGRNPLGWWIASTYALTFGPSLVYGYVYWTRERAEGISLARVAWFAHLYVCYGMMWYASGWWAVGRTLRGRTGWAKTDRVTEAPVAELAAVTAAAVAGDTQAAVPASPAEAVPVSPPQLLAGPPPSAALAAAAAAGSPPDDPPATIPPPVIHGQAGPERAAPHLIAQTTQPQSMPGAALTPAGPPLRPDAPPHPRRRRGRRTMVVSAVAVTCAALAFFLAWPGMLDGDADPSQWRTVFSGYGGITVDGSGAAAVISLSPAQARTAHATHSALVISASRYTDFTATLRVETLRQLRQGAAGWPHPWEAAWVVWHYDSDQRFYAMTLEVNGWVLSKQDPAYPGGERFLASGLLPRFRIGARHTVGVVQIGRQIDVSADGRLLTRFTDTQRPYLNGAFGLYDEDSDARFDHIQVRAIPPAQTGTSRPASRGSPSPPAGIPPKPTDRDTP